MNQTMTTIPAEGKSDVKMVTTTTAAVAPASIDIGGAATAAAPSPSPTTVDLPTTATTSSSNSFSPGGGGGVSGFVLKLFSMINGADDDIVSWTPAGDAFIIGSDIQKLEAETLPKFFRHNRFQSLVRQLNFYSFRKINRERNVWIYKHDLFHRDRPNDLHKVRRRTCPGVDGRKQRFSRLSAQRLNSPADGKSSNGSNSPTNDDCVPFGHDSIDHRSVDFEPTVSDDDDVSMDDGTSSVIGRESYYSMPAASMDTVKGFDAYHHQGYVTAPYHSIMTDVGASDDVVTSHGMAGNSSLLSDSIGADGAEGDDEDVDGVKIGDSFDANDRKKRRMEMMQQSLVVSEVAVKLEEYVKKAMKERGLTSRNRRGGSGIVTPPFGTAHTISSSDLITYDDEYFYEEHNTKTDVGASNKVGGAENAIGGPFCTVVSKDDDSPYHPVTTEEDVKRITQEIVQKSSDANQEVLHACANVAAFFLCTRPNERPEDCCEKVLELLSTSPRLQTDFYSYRMALHPDLSSAKVGVPENHALYLRKALLGGAAGRLASLRDFKVFAVNLIYKLLGVNGSLGIDDVFQPDDRAILLRTTEVWSKSIGVGA